MTAGVNRQIRRLRSPDLKFFRELQTHAVHFAHSKSLHSKWVDKATREIIAGERIGYGLFDTSGDPPYLLGCILLRCTSSNVIELKNLVVRPSIQGPLKFRAYESLVSRAELASKYRGFSRLEIELLSTDYEQIELFLSLGYAIQPSHESVPAIGIPHYLLWKHVPPEYHGDPFDHLSMARWLFAERLHWLVSPPEPIVFGTNSEQLAFRLRFEVPAHSSGRARHNRDGATLKGTASGNVPTDDNEQGGIASEKHFRITGDCIVDCGMGDLADFTALLQQAEEGLERSSLRFILSTRQIKGLQNAALRAGFRPVLGSDLLRMIGYSSVDEPLVLNKEAVQGVVLHVGPSDIEALRKFCASGTSFSYVVLNGVGDVIYQGLTRDEEAEFFAVFCTDSEAISSKDDDRRMVIVGWAQVEDAVPRRFDLVEEELRGRKTLWHGKTDIRFFVNPFSVNFHENDMVYILHLRGPRLLKEELPLYDVGVDDAAMKPLLVDAQLYGFSACYAEKLVSMVRNRQPKEWESVSLDEGLPHLPIELELLIGLKSSLSVIGASNWLHPPVALKNPSDLRKA